jgi:RHS repeat-associated protein
VTADTTGGDTSRTVSYAYNNDDQKQSYTDGAGNQTKYTSYDGYGNLLSETDAAGNVTNFTYDDNSRLKTKTLENYSGGVAGQTGSTITEDSRAYDPAGRLVSDTDATGRVTKYAYTDNGLTASVTETASGSGTYTEQSDTYDAAGNLTAKVTNNGATTTNYAVDAGNQVTSQTVDPSGLDRVTSYTYDPDDNVTSQSTAQGSNSAIQSTSYTYDAMGDKTSQTLNDPGAEGPVGWWDLTQSSGTTVSDSSGTGNLATASGVTWTSGDGAQLSGQSGDITTRGPVADTTGSFSVSAWVNLAGTTGTDEEVASQDAGSVAGFYLKYNSANGHWQFTRPEQDENNPTTWATADSGSQAQTGTWTFLTGVYDASSGAVQLYVNGTDVGSTGGADGNDTTPLAAHGALEIGAAKWNGQSGWGTFDGKIAGVEVYPTALSAAEVSNLKQQATPSAQNFGGDIVRGNLTTGFAVDQLGQVTAQNDPDGQTTSFAYDPAGHQTTVTEPQVVTESSAGAPSVTSGKTLTGYDTFGDVAQTQDENGNITTSTYNGDGQQLTQTLPSYTPPGASSPINGTTTTTYTPLEQVKTQTDPDNNETTFTYDQLGHQTSTEDNTTGATTSSTYDADGNLATQTSPTGGQSTFTYDFLGRQVTSTQVERYLTPGSMTQSSPASYTTTTSYTPATGDLSGTWPSSVTTPAPDSATTSYQYNAAGEATQSTDGAGNVTSYAYDALGRKVSTTNPDKTVDTVTYDPAGNVTAQTSLDTDGKTVLAATSATYDGEGDKVSATDANGNTTVSTYDQMGDLTAETQPVTSSAGIITSFGYDPAGNQTAYTDGNGNLWGTTYNSWNLPQTHVEPTTSAYTTPANSTTTIAYNGDQEKTAVTEPGGVTQTYTYDSLGDIKSQAGSGASAATATRTFTYDNDSNMTAAATSNTASSGSNATSESFTYDDRGLVTGATGSAGTTALGYNGDGQLSSAQVPAGTSSYAYDGDGRLATMNDAATGQALTYDYNPMSQVSKVIYGTSSTPDVQSYGYNNLHRLTSDTLSAGTTASPVLVASIGYQYDTNGNITQKATTSLGTAGTTTNTYAYDEASRLTSWNNGTATTAYSYDNNGNRTQAGTVTYAYDARDELTSDGTSSYSYTANGDLSSVTGPSGTTASTSDAYGQQATQGTQASTYDALGRDTQLTAGSTVTSLSYQGASGQVTSDGASNYTWTPGGTLTGTSTSGTGTLDLTDAHTDLVAQFTATATTLTASRSYGPWGAVTATSATALTGSLGYQSQYTSPLTGQTSMGARWYNPATGDFGNKDTVANDPVPDSASASPYAYAADNPLTGTDPSGHWPCLSPSCLVNDATGVASAAVGAATAVCVIPGCAAIGSAVQSALKPPAAKPAVPVQQATLLPVITHNATLLPVITPVKKAPVTAPPPTPKAAPKAAPKPAPKPAPKTTPAKPRSPAPSNPFSSFNSSGCELDCGISSAMNGTCPSFAGVQIAPLGLDEEVSGAGAAPGGAGTAGCGQGPTLGGFLKFLGNISGITQDEHCLQDPSVVQCLEGVVNGALAIATILDLGTTSELDIALNAAEDTGDLTEGELADLAATCGGKSFTANTQVLLPGGKTAPIASLKPGDKVQATSTATGKTQPETVTAVLVHHDTNLYNLTVKAGGHTEVVHTTANHLFWDPAKKQWVQAAELRKGEHLKTANGVTAVAVGGTTPKVHDGWMWDLTVPGNNDHDFYILPATNTNRYTRNVVAGNTPVLVHNSDGCGLADLAALRKSLGLPPAGPGVPTLGRLDIDGKSFYGISAHGQPIDFEVNAITRTHAEADAFQQAKNAGVTAKTATWYVDYPGGLCKSCGQFGGLRSLARQLGLQEVTVVYPGGSFPVPVG